MPGALLGAEKGLTDHQGRAPVCAQGSQENRFSFLLGRQSVVELRGLRVSTCLNCSPGAAKAFCIPTGEA